MEQEVSLDFPIPNEIIEIVTTYLSTEDLLLLFAVGSERLKECTLKVLRNKLKELPSLLWQISIKGDLEKIKQIFAFVNQENIGSEEMGVTNCNCDNCQDAIYYGKKPKLVDTNCDSTVEILWKYNYGSTPFIEAASYGHHQMCKYVITKEKANLEATDHSQNTALICAASSNKIEVIKVLPQYTAYWSLYNGNLDDLKMLVEKDGDGIELKVMRGKTPLIIASIRGRVDLCKYLVEE